jgi:hypothetical protein
MSIHNWYVNQPYLEASMVDGYNTEEITTFYLGYLKDKVCTGLLVP